MARSAINMHEKMMSKRFLLYAFIPDKNLNLISEFIGYSSAVKYYS